MTILIYSAPNDEASVEPTVGGVGVDVYNYDHEL